MLTPADTITSAPAGDEQVAILVDPADVARGERRIPERGCGLLGISEVPEGRGPGLEVHVRLGVGREPWPSSSRIFTASPTWIRPTVPGRASHSSVVASVMPPSLTPKYSMNTGPSQSIIAA